MRQVNKKFYKLKKGNIGMAQKGKRQDRDGYDTQCMHKDTPLICTSDGETLLALPLLTESMTQALYRHML